MYHSFLIHSSADGHLGRGKVSACNAEDTGFVGWIAKSGTSPGGGNGNSVQYSYQRIPWTKEPGGPQSTGLQRVRHN